MTDMGARSDRGISRRYVLSLATCLAASTLAPVAWAGSYLDRAALLVHEGLRETAYLRRRVGDRELARLIHELASARLESASRMSVPKEVAQAHPHLLLVLENFERAAEAAKKGEIQKFVIYEQRALEEERTLKSVLKQLGWSLPELDGRST